MDQDVFHLFAGHSYDYSGQSYCGSFSSLEEAKQAAQKDYDNATVYVPRGKVLSLVAVMRTYCPSGKPDYKAWDESESVQGKDAN